MLCKLMFMFASALSLAIAQERPPTKPQGWTPEYTQQQEQERRQQQETIKQAQQQVVTNPDSAEAYFNLGEAYRNGGRDNAKPAEEAYKRAILRKPDYAQAYKGLAWAYDIQEQHSKQVEALEQAIKLDPGDAEAYCKLGDAYTTFDLGRRGSTFPSEDEVKLAVEAHRKKAAMAVEAYEQAIRIKPNYAEAYSGLGSAYLTLQRHQEAIEAYHRAIEYDDNNPLMHIGLGTVYLLMKDYRAALEQHKLAMQLIENTKPLLRDVYEMAAVLFLSRVQEMMKEKRRR